MRTELNSPFNVADFNRDLRLPFTGAALPAVVGLAGAALLVYLATEVSVKLIAAAVGAAICVSGAFISGNPRLYCLWGLMFTIPFDLSKRFGPIFLKLGGESSFRLELSDVFLLPLAIFVLRDIWTGRLKGLRIPKVTIVWFVIMLMGVGWIIAGPWRMTAAHEVVRMLKVMILFLVVCNELQRPNRILHCVTGITLGVALQSVVAVIQYVTRAHLGLDLLGETGTVAIKNLESTSVQGEKVFRVGAFLSHPNLLGIFLAALIPVAIGAFLLRLGKGHKLFFLTTAGLGMAALVATLSRSGWLSFAASFTLLMILMILHRGLRRRSLLAASVATLTLLLVSAIFAPQIMARIFSSRVDAMLGRAEYLHDAWGMIRAKPLLGWGLNSYVLAVGPFTKYHSNWAARKHYKDWIPPVHNIYFLWWAETGIIGLALHVLLLVCVVWPGFGNLRVKNEMLFAVNAACLSAMLAFWVDGFFSLSLRFNHILRVFWVLAAIMMAVRYLRLQESKNAPALGRTQPADALLARHQHGGGPRWITPVHP
jgi:putative inorganic carbon (HCO3(-)) transporter